MNVEIDEVVSTIRVVDEKNPLMNSGQLQALIEAVLQAVEGRLARNAQRSAATGIPDDGRGGVDRQEWGSL
jgi:hypothetical protein